jgi:hypothetical protein
MLMTRIGRYNPANEEVTSNLFVYGESPVTSTKLNHWDGNIDAGFWLVHHALRMLVGTDEVPKVIGPESSEPLKIRAQATPDMTVRIEPGILVGPAYLAGLSVGETLPLSGVFTAPTANPRIDSIGLLESGEWVITTGTEAESPTAPSLPDGAVCLANLFLRVGATSILDTDDTAQAYLIDLRPSQVTCRAHQHASLTSLGDVQIEGSLDASGPAELGDSFHTLTLFQSACEGTPVLNSSGIPEVLYNGQENYWYPRLAATNGHLSFACPLSSPGSRIKDVKLILRLMSSGEAFNLSILARASQTPESLNSILDFAGTDYTDSACTSVGNDYYSFSQTLNHTLASNTQIWVRIRLRADTYGADCRFLGLEWTFEERRY